jgi:hypothetical protein
LELIGQECLGEVYNITKIKINRNFNAFADLKSFKLEVPRFCLVIGCVSGRRDRRYCITALFAAVYWVSVERPRLVEIIDMTPEVFRALESWPTASRGSRRRTTFLFVKYKWSSVSCVSSWRTISYKIHLDDGKTFLLRGEGQIHTDLEIKYQSVAENLYFLPILIDRNTECLHYRTGVTMYGLVVTRANSDRPGIFKRFGVWEIIFNVGSYPELMIPFLTQPDTLMDKSLYGNFLQDEEGGSHSYSITLV